MTSRRRLSRSLLAWPLGTLVFALASCATAPVIPPIEETVPDDPGSVIAVQPAPAPRPAVFDDLPNWDGADLLPARKAFLRSCNRIRARSASSAFSNRVAYAGRVEDWLSACDAMALTMDNDGARLVFEALFVPMEILSADGSSRFTGYFEPEIMARRTPQFPFTQPVPALPGDLVQVDGSAIGGAPGETVPAQRLPNGELRAYPPRADIAQNASGALGYAHPADVFFLQIQGSGRLTFEDGTTIRAAYAAHNGQPFRSVANWLLSEGKIARSEATMEGIRAWMDRVPRAEAQAAMNVNPRFVFFRPLPIDDPAVGPVGAEGVPLTPLGSMAVDTSIHPLGVPFFVQTTGPGLGGDWSGALVAQDSGGAINGRVRGDIYFGTGVVAGDRAGTQNAPGRKWALLPRIVADRILAQPGLPDS
ncbi:MAG: MltA domain-containing protein [Pseudomonadota bacterium]